MKVKIEKDDCIGCGLCVSFCPDVFSMGSDEKADAVAGEIKTELVQDCKQAAMDCPVNVIKITE